LYDINRKLAGGATTGIRCWPAVLLGKKQRFDIQANINEQKWCVNSIRPGQARPSQAGPINAAHETSASDA
jgi:hypothetical protein